MSTIESVMHETRVFPPSEAFKAQAAISGMAAYKALCARAEADYEGFWADLARENVVWKQPFSKVLDESDAPFYKWFADGKLNVSYNCLDKNIEAGLGDKTAIIFEADDGQVTKVTYKELLARVGHLANGLKKLGVKNGDRVVIYLPMSIEGIVAMQACARIGAIHSVVFGGFSAHSLRDRIEDAGAVMVITADGQRRGGKDIPLKPAVDEALTLGGCDTIRNVVVYRRTGEATNWTAGRDLWWDDVTAGQSAQCEPEWVGAEHPLFLLYTSGSTGKPKGVQHATGGFLLHAVVTMKWTFDIKPTDVFWCTADIGWITGHTYGAYGPLACGATEIVFEGVPTYPDAGRFWHMIQEHKISVFYTAPTAIRALIKLAGAHPEQHPSKYDLSSLRLLGTVGEPINPEAWMWYHEQIGGGRCPIVDTWWQTETGGHMITPLPGATPTVPGSCTLPLPGIMAGVVDETGHDVEWGKGGLLVIKRPWPSMIRTIWGDPERYRKNYYPEELGGKLYLAGDGSVRDPETGYFTIMGRIDDVLNVSGHRLGTMEVESALVANPLVAEAAVVGKPHDVKGEAIVAYVVLKRQRPTGAEAVEIVRQLRDWVAKEIGPIAKPDEIRFGDNLPKTRSGKIMRRLLRALAKGDEITQDVSTLENPAILDQLKEAVK
ncbi:MAG: acetate--CoA ligase [Hydrogenophilales bacterium CG03_land_8_20_14_0_80_62_28]|nr:acetate--CoA ligase [Betaproteobacteria bacterium]OIO78136.1 MAG: acetate--CoA ligase [Hydrogenophilaceae bacterium CG1_02_62_390]PIV22603.1 MAG: acetate--CoA ligase [Hydrogenophilales bacterium CG03_land_8_20_14_0_80_62_28]PIW38836.1 MAG: acetate--CoA ligase [Hydrogenophilales bacterium CG15_BIG_FIL_POST_REV_8_21_14_020_62_31]PIW72645.1 MAG: acetate--CoA ligase [Hydrogenophilales bacterium CG12_big_fil_rev_8_21_14_0_65_61_21]PIX01034.1 MAG: acetate--CoA ligase [Hydrogenophilales bacterium 